MDSPRCERDGCNGLVIVGVGWPVTWYCERHLPVVLDGRAP